MKALTASQPKRKFEEFLGLDNNHRIIFSGIFGNGKTTFLKRYFNEDKDYLSIHLFPTNYTTNKNEDVFELIKFDILYEILKFKPGFNEFKFEEVYAAYLAIFKASDNLIEPITPLIEAIPKIGKSLSIILKTVFKLDEAIKKEIKETEDSESKDILEFTKRFVDKIGSPYENDFYTELIKNLLERVKEEHNKKKTILIIDDLDRIDPDQIFRLLNVFSVQFDVEGTENKFDFDKILFCCDANNIRKIFHNRFGLDVDFNGYFDKFYSNEIFHFDNKSEIKSRAGEILLTIQPLKGKLWDKSRVNSSEATSYGFIRYFIESMIVSETFNLRQLIRLNDYKYEERKYKIRDLFKSSFSNHNIYIAITFDFLVSVYGSIDGFMSAIKRTGFSKTDPVGDYVIERLVGDLIMLSDYRHNKFQSKQEFKHLKSNVKYMIAADAYDPYYSVFYATILKGDRVDWIDSVDLGGLILEAFTAYAAIRGETIHD
jgi:hypothetical protein